MKSPLELRFEECKRKQEEEERMAMLKRAVPKEDSAPEKPLPPHRRKSPAKISEPAPVSVVEEEAADNEVAQIISMKQDPSKSSTSGTASQMQAKKSRIQSSGGVTQMSNRTIRFSQTTANNF